MTEEVTKKEVEVKTEVTPVTPTIDVGAELEKAQQEKADMEKAYKAMQAGFTKSQQELAALKDKQPVELTDEQKEEKKRALDLGLGESSQMTALQQSIEALQKQIEDRDIKSTANTLKNQVDQLKIDYPFVDEAKIVARMKKSNVSPQEAAQLEYFDEIALTKTKGKAAVPTVEKPTREIELPKGKVPEIGSQAMRDMLMNTMFGEE